MFGRILKGIGKKMSDEDYPQLVDGGHDMTEETERVYAEASKIAGEARDLAMEHMRKHGYDVKTSSLVVMVEPLMPTNLDGVEGFEATEEEGPGYVEMIAAIPRPDAEDADVSVVVTMFDNMGQLSMRLLFHILGPEGMAQLVLSRQGGGDEQMDALRDVLRDLGEQDDGSSTNGHGGA